MKNGIWDKLAHKYDRLWVQKYSLTPTRKKVLSILAENYRNKNFSLLDIGCATGQLLFEVNNQYPDAKLLGLDKSEEMISRAQNQAKNAYLFCANIDECSLSEYMDENSLDFIVCCHSFPYYKNKKAVLQKLCRLLKDNGKIIFAQASINNVYDRFIMAIIETTAEPADYLSKKKFRELAGDYFNIRSEFVIKERFFMPTICAFVMEKRI